MMRLRATLTHAYLLLYFLAQLSVASVHYACCVHLCFTLSQVTLHVMFKIDPARRSIMYVESAINKGMMEELTSPTH